MATLLVPCAGKSSRYPGVRPKWMLTTPDGQLAVQKAVASVFGAATLRTIIAIRKDHDENFGASTVLRRAFGSAIEILVIEYDTNGPAETVSLMIERGQVSGDVLIKDADSFFLPSEFPAKSFVAVSDLRECMTMSRVGAKSFIALNEQGIIAAIVEKCVVSNYVSSGLYAFDDAEKYKKWFSEIRKIQTQGEIFISHVISHAIASGEIFLPLNIHCFIDIGTLSDWKQYVAQQQLYIVDIDGVVFLNQSQFFPPYWGEPVTPIAENVAKLKQLQQEGGQLIFVTSRPEKYRDVTEAALLQCDLKPHALVMGATHAARILVNDFAPSNPYPSAQAINITRNAPDLPRFLP